MLYIETLLLFIPLKNTLPIYLDSAKLAMTESVYYRYEKMLQYSIIPELGHLKLKTTNRYVHATDQAERESANLLENILNKKAQHTA